jgi:hypothetical protein
VRITLDTRLADVGAENATDVGDDLIDTSRVGDDWGLAWDRVVRWNSDATVRDLRDELLSCLETAS